jgi:hypothetical protein
VDERGIDSTTRKANIRLAVILGVVAIAFYVAIFVMGTE